MYYLIIAAILPCYYLCHYIDKHDINKEDRKLLYKIFIFGILTVIPACILEILLADIFPIKSNMDYIEIFINTFFGIALIEEFFKFLVVKKIAYSNKNCDEVYDLIVYSVYSSIGFACLENILYVLDGGFGLALLRGILAVPGHATDGVIMGYYFGKAKFNNNKLYLFKALLYPSILHCIYDSLIEISESNSIYILVFFIYVILTYIVSIKLVKKISNNKLSTK